jgi:hypothetical protein
MHILKWPQLPRPKRFRPHIEENLKKAEALMRRAPQLLGDRVVNARISDAANRRAPGILKRYFEPVKDIKPYVSIVYFDEFTAVYVNYYDCSFRDISRNYSGIGIVNLLATYIGSHDLPVSSLLVYGMDLIERVFEPNHWWPKAWNRGTPSPEAAARVVQDLVQVLFRPDVPEDILIEVVAGFASSIFPADFRSMLTASAQSEINRLSIQNDANR